MFGQVTDNKVNLVYCGDSWRIKSILKICSAPYSCSKQHICLNETQRTWFTFRNNKTPKKLAYCCVADSMQCFMGAAINHPAGPETLQRDRKRWQQYCTNLRGRRGSHIPSLSNLSFTEVLERCKDEIPSPLNTNPVYEAHMTFRLQLI